MKKLLFLAAVLVLSSVSAFATISCAGGGQTLTAVVAAGGCTTTNLTGNGGGTVDLIFDNNIANVYFNLNSNGAAPAAANILVTEANNGLNTVSLTFSANFSAVALAGNADGAFLDLKFLYTLHDNGTSRFASGNVAAGLNGIASVDDPTEGSKTNAASMLKFVTAGNCNGGICASDIIQVICPQASGNCGGPNFVDGPKSINGPAGNLGVSDTITLLAVANTGSGTLNASSISNTFAFSTGIPEPLTFFTLGGGLLALGVFRRFRK
jgi:hypothetical protein